MTAERGPEIINEQSLKAVKRCRCEQVKRLKNKPMKFPAPDNTGE